jgi:hypothetical protein
MRPWLRVCRVVFALLTLSLTMPIASAAYEGASPPPPPGAGEENTLRGSELGKYTDVYANKKSGGEGILVGIAAGLALAFFAAWGLSRLGKAGLQTHRWLSRPMSDARYEVVRMSLLVSVITVPAGALVGHLFFPRG